MTRDAFPLHIHQVNASDGGVPKHAVESAVVSEHGLDSDRQAHPKAHGGPDRAVCLLGLDVIERLRAEGHPIAPGTTGENLTVAGLDWADAQPGARFVFATGLVLEAVSYAQPCGNIRPSFLEGEIQLFHADKHPQNARLYARVLVPGTVKPGDSLRLERAR